VGSMLVSPFRYPGGKTWLLGEVRCWLASRCLKPEVLVEPFAGGGSVSLYAIGEGLVDRAVLVELDPDVACVWRVMLSADADALCTKIRSFRADEGALNDALAVAPDTEVNRAFAVLLRNRTNHGGILATGAGRLRRGERGKGLFSRWYPETLARRIHGIHDMRGRLEFREGDGLGVMGEWFGERAVWFVDPPYVEGNRNAGARLYRYSDVPVDSVLDACAGFGGDFLLTYEDDGLIREKVGGRGFRMASVEVKTRSHTRRNELLIGGAPRTEPVLVGGRSPVGALDL